MPKSTDSGKALVEMTGVSVLHATFGKQFQLFAQAGQSGRRLLWREEFAWMWIKGHDSRRQAGLLRRQGQALQQSLMAQVHAVEITDGERQRLPGRLRKMTENLHAARPWRAA